MDFTRMQSFDVSRTTELFPPFKTTIKTLYNRRWIGDILHARAVTLKLLDTVYHSAIQFITRKALTHRCEFYGEVSGVGLPSACPCSHLCVHAFESAEIFNISS